MMSLILLTYTFAWCAFGVDVLSPEQVAADVLSPEQVATPSPVPQTCTLHAELYPNVAPEQDILNQGGPAGGRPGTHP